MEEIARLDRRLFYRELFRFGRVFLTLFGLGWLAVMAASGMTGVVWTIAWLIAILGAAGLTALRASIAKRFIHRRFGLIWEGCEDRLARLEQVLKRVRKDKLADLQEMPKTVRRIGEAIYIALRKADVLSHEVQATERGVLNQPPSWASLSSDPQAQELYRLADKNIALYRQQFAGVMAGVQRVEAQAAVFITTLDSLRMQLIGHRLVGRSPELSSHDMLTALTEARLQLDAIDKALDELDFSQMPQMIAVVPPKQQSVEQGEA